MSKMMAIIDEPECCMGCKLCSSRSGKGFRCNLSGRYMDSVDLNKRPEWCELREIPEKKSEWEKEVFDSESLDLGEHVGWNDCIDYILGKNVRSWEEKYECDEVTKIVVNEMPKSAWDCPFAEYANNITIKHKCMFKQGIQSRCLLEYNEECDMLERMR